MSSVRSRPFGYPASAKSFFAPAGIRVQINIHDSGAFWVLGSEEDSDRWKRIQLIVGRFSSVPDPSYYTRWHLSSQVGIWNWERWTSEEFDRLYAEGIAEQDLDKRKSIYLRMQDIMEETGAYVWINHEPTAYVHRAGMTISTAPSGELDYRRFEFA